MLTLWPLLTGLVESAPAWVAIAFAAYAVGRGEQFNLKDLLIFVTAEAIALAVASPAYMIAR
jgi:hypothetical protein